MSKQIEEIANYITEGARQAVEDAEALYNAGYRLATEVAEEIFAEINRTFKALLVGDISDVVKILAELKKKYTESEETE